MHTHGDRGGLVLAWADSIDHDLNVIVDVVQCNQPYDFILFCMRQRHMYIMDFCGSYTNLRISNKLSLLNFQNDREIHRERPF